MTTEHYAVLKQEDMLKVDFGVHVKGRILDSAFTLTWDHTYDKLLEAVEAATNAGVRVSFGRTASACCLPYLRKLGSMYGSATLPRPSRKQWSPTRLRLEEKYYLVGSNRTLAFLAC